MGYRSDLKMTITVNEKKDSVEKILNELKSLKGSEGTKLFDEKWCKFEKYVSISPKHKNVIRISFDYVKWYDYFDDVKAFEEWRGTLKDRGHTFHYVRMGESADDIEEIIEMGTGTNEPLEYVDIFRGIEFES